VGVASRPADPREARTRYLDRLPPEEQAVVMRRAETAGPAPDDADWFVAEAAASAAERIEAAAVRIERALGARPGTARAATPWRDLAIYAGGLTSAVVLAWTLAWLGPRGGALGLSYAAAAALVVAALVALWREAPKPSRALPTRELVGFAGGLVAAVAIAWLVTVGHVILLPMRFAGVAAAGVAIGLLWRSKR
jgi:hypothetical protein